VHKQWQSIFRYTAAHPISALINTGLTTMRNDARDEINELPSLSAARIEPSLQASSSSASEAFTAQSPTHVLSDTPQSNKAIGVLSALTLALLCAGGTFAWWSMQRIERLEQQLVATQDSFSRISEDAAGRIKDISGKFTATESSVLSDNEVLKMRLNKIESAAVEAAKQQQINLSEHASRLTKISGTLDALKTTTNQQQQAVEQQKNTLNTLQKELNARLEQQHQQLTELTKSSQINQQQLAQWVEQGQTLRNLTSKLNTLQKSAVTTEEVTRLQQDILILRSELEQRSSAPAVLQQGPSIADFDAYRAQTNRTISALQEQVRNVQKNAP